MRKIPLFVFMLIASFCFSSLSFSQDAKTNQTEVSKKAETVPKISKKKKERGKKQRGSVKKVKNKKNKKEIK